MKIANSRKLEFKGEKVQLLNNLKKILLDAGIKECRDVSPNEFEFYPYGLFRYANFQLFSLIDLGNIKIESKGGDIYLLHYKVTSYRIWLLVFLILVICLTIVNDGFLNSILYASIFCLSAFSTIYIRHRIFFQFICKKVIA